MKFSISLLTLTTLLTTSLAAPLESRATTVTISYDERYDNPAGRILDVACSNGVHGLNPPYNVFQDLPSWPSIGGSPTITGWGSDQCGQCYKLSYTGATGMTNSIYVTAIDSAPGGFNIALKALDKLTGGLGTNLGRVQGTYELSARNLCGFPAAAA